MSGATPSQVADLPLPCERAVRYLFAGNLRRCSVQEVEDWCHRVMRIDTRPHRASIERIRQHVESTRPRPYLRSGGRPASGWTAAQGIDALVDPDDDVQAAIRILHTTDARPALEALLIAGVRDDLAAGYLTNYLVADQDYSAETVRHYRQLFWDRARLTQDQWYLFLLGRPDPHDSGARVGGYEQGADLWNAYFTPAWSTLQAMGVPIEGLDMRTALLDISMRLHKRILTLEAYGDPIAVARVYRSYTQGILDIYRRLGGQSHVASVVEALKQIELKRDSLPLPSIEELIAEENILFDGRAHADQRLLGPAEEGSDE